MSYEVQILKYVENIFSLSLKQPSQQTNWHNKNPSNFEKLQFLILLKLTKTSILPIAKSQIPICKYYDSRIVQLFIASVSLVRGFVREREKMFSKYFGHPWRILIFLSWLTFFLVFIKLSHQNNLNQKEKHLGNKVDNKYYFLIGCSMPSNVLPFFVTVETGSAECPGFAALSTLLEWTSYYPLSYYLSSVKCMVVG